MIMDNNALTAFQTAAGISADKMSLFFRTILIILVLVWAVWCVKGTNEHFSQHEKDIVRFAIQIIRILFLATIAVALVFIS